MPIKSRPISMLRPQLDKIEGFLSIERFESLAQPGKILLLSCEKFMPTRNDGLPIVAAFRSKPLAPINRHWVAPMTEKR